MDQGDFEPAVGERRDWRDFWADHSNCGGTWVYIKDSSSPRVICSCGMERSRFAEGGVVTGTAGGPYCGVCGAPAEGPGFTTTPGVLRCPNRCDPIAARPITEPCSNCERCTWNPGPDCGRPEHPHCPTCGHCNGRHYADKDWPTGPPDTEDSENQSW